MTILKSALIILCLAFPLAACDSNDGKAEQLGEKIDNAGNEARDKLDDAADEVKDGVEDACEKATDKNC
ncbi:MAG TPA: hypothetical protein VIM59_06985 [Cellvibrio sp.]